MYLYGNLLLLFTSSFKETWVSNEWEVLGNPYWVNTQPTSLHVHNDLIMFGYDDMNGNLKAYNESSNEFVTIGHPIAVEVITVFRLLGKTTLIPSVDGKRTNNRTIVATVDSNNLVTQIYGMGGDVCSDKRLYDNNKCDSWQQHYWDIIYHGRFYWMVGSNGKQRGGSKSGKGLFKSKDLKTWKRVTKYINSRGKKANNYLQSRSYWLAKFDMNKFCIDSYCYNPKTKVMIYNLNFKYGRLLKPPFRTSKGYTLFFRRDTNTIRYHKSVQGYGRSVVIKYILHEKAIYTVSKFIDLALSPNRFNIFILSYEDHNVPTGKGIYFGVPESDKWCLVKAAPSDTTHIIATKEYLYISGGTNNTISRLKYDGLPNYIM